MTFVRWRWHLFMSYGAVDQDRCARNAHTLVQAVEIAPAIHQLDRIRPALRLGDDMTTTQDALVVRRVPIAELAPDPNNARRHSAHNIDAIRASLRRFGQRRPILIDHDQIVIAGNGTMQAALLEGWTHLDTIEFPGTVMEARAYALADNRTAELAHWDTDELIGTLRSLDADLTVSTGWTTNELATLLGIDQSGGDGTQAQLGVVAYRVLVECDGEEAQAKLIAALEADGYSCRAIMS